MSKSNCVAVLLNFDSISSPHETSLFPEPADAVAKILTWYSRYMNKKWGLSFTFSAFVTCILLLTGVDSASAEETSTTVTKDLLSNGYFVTDVSAQLPGEGQGFGGTILSIRGRIIEIQRKGQIFEVDQESLNFTELPVKIPFTDFVERSFGERGLAGVKSAAYDSKSKILYVSTVQIKDDCAYSTIYSLGVNSNPFSLKTPKLYLQIPDCVPVPPLAADFPAITANEKHDQPNLSQASGKLITLSNGDLLWSIGNYGDKWRSVSTMVKDLKDTSNYWGKTVLINQQKNITVFSSGHRNIQGLYESANGDIIASEHGPEGGDELNILKKGSYYGWPFSSLGHDYSAPDKTYSSSSDFPPVTRIKTAKSTAPLFAWVPSIAPSQILSVPENSALSLWKNAYLLGTLKDASLHRIVVNPENAAVILDEKIPLEMRVRDMAWGKSSSLFLLSDDSSVHRLTFAPRAK